MNKFNEGGEVYHKATGKRCVVINISEDGMIKVRTEDDVEKDYYPQELKTIEEVEAESRSFTANMPDDTGFGY